MPLHCMFNIIQESPAGDDSPSNSLRSTSSYGSDAPLLPGTPDLLMSRTFVNVGSLYPYNGNCSIH